MLYSIRVLVRILALPPENISRELCILFVVTEQVGRVFLRGMFALAFVCACICLLAWVAQGSRKTP